MLRAVIERALDREAYRPSLRSADAKAATGVTEALNALAQPPRLLRGRLGV